MPTATKHPASISATLDGAAAGAAVYRTGVRVPQWDDIPTATAADSRLLTIAEAAGVVPLSVKQLYRVAEREDGPFRKVENRWMAYEDELHRWIKAHPIGSKPDAPAADGDSLADRVRRRRKGGAS